MRPVVLACWLIVVQCGLWCVWLADVQLGKLCMGIIDIVGGFIALVIVVSTLPNILWLCWCYVKAWAQVTLGLGLDSSDAADSDSDPDPDEQRRLLNAALDLAVDEVVAEAANRPTGDESTCHCRQRPSPLKL